MEVERTRSRTTRGAGRLRRCGWPCLPPGCAPRPISYGCNKRLFTALKSLELGVYWTAS
jgi:hypothetical protein